MRPVDAVLARLIQIRIAKLHRFPQRRAAPEIGSRVRAVLEQKPGLIQMVVGDGDQQRSHGVRFGLIDVGLR
jgi:hypothetical protein